MTDPLNRGLPKNVSAFHWASVNLLYPIVSYDSIIYGYIIIK